jgi:hypothetical protein
VRCKSGIKRIEVIVVETDTIVCDPEADYGWILFVEESLLALDVDPDAPGDFWFNIADRLRRIDYRLEQWKEWLPFRKACLVNLVLKVDLDRHDGSLPSQGRLSGVQEQILSHLGNQNKLYPMWIIWSGVYGFSWKR